MILLILSHTDLSDVLGVELSFLAPTASGIDAGARFCVPLPGSPPRLGGITTVLVQCSS